MGRPFQVHGHRGARGLFAENTLGGFQRTVALGVRRIELDVAVLRDGTVVVHHDLALNPDMTRLGGRWLAGSLPLLSSLTPDDLEDFDVGRACPGSETAVRFPDQLPLDGERIPTLAQALALDASLEWTIELKLQPDRPDWTVGPEEMVERVLAVVDAAGMAGQVRLQSFDWRAPRHLRRLRPEVARAWLTRAETVSDPALWWGRTAAASVAEAVMDEGGGVWSPELADLSRDVVAAARGLGLPIVPWTVNEIADMQSLAEWGASGLITDFPDRALALASAA